MLKKFLSIISILSLSTTAFVSIPNAVFANEDNFVNWLQTVKANDEFFTLDKNNTNLQWYLPKIQMSQAWNIRRESPNITVAVIDTGIHADHQDLNGGQVIAGYNIYCKTIVNDSCTEPIRGPIPANTNSDDNGHGTSVASIIAANVNNFIGIAGINWNVKIMPIKVLNAQGLGTATDVAEGITWAAQRGADIINLSLGSNSVGDSEIITKAVQLAYNEGALVIAAAGNDKSLTGKNLNLEPSAPVCSDNGVNNVFGVAATDWNDQKANFSNYGSNCIDISAPGVRILTAFYNPNEPSANNVYAFRSGTSFATAVVSGVAALVKAQFSELNINDLQTHLRKYSVPIDNLNTSLCNGSSCSGQLGSGRIDAWFSLAAEDPNTAAAPTTTPETTDPEPEQPVAVNEGDIVVSDTSNLKYLIQQGQRRWLIDFVAQQRSIDTTKVKTITQQRLEEIPLGSPLPPKDGTLIKGDTNPTVYVLNKGIAHAMTYFSFTTNKFSFAKVVSLEQTFVSRLQKGKEYAPAEGILIKNPNDPLVYFVENRELHPITYQGFINRGLSFANITVMPQGEINLYPIGETYWK